MSPTQCVAARTTNQLCWHIRNKNHLIARRVASPRVPIRGTAPSRAPSCAPSRAPSCAPMTTTVPIPRDVLLYEELISNAQRGLAEGVASSLSRMFDPKHVGRNPAHYHRSSAHWVHVRKAILVACWNDWGAVVATMWDALCTLTSVNLATNVFLTDEASYCDSALQYAASYGSENVIKVLIRLRKPTRKPTYGALLCYIDNSNARDKSALDCAVDARQFYAARLLLRCEANVGITSEFEETPLLKAISNDDFRMARLLLGSKANVAHECFSCSYFTPLHLAARHNRLRIIGALIDARADVNAASSLGRRTPLHTAAEYGHAQAVSAILCAKGDATRCDMRGNTPLMVAQRSFAERFAFFAERFAETFGVLEALLAGK